MHRLGVARHDTEAEFRRQVWLQVYLPLGLGVLLLGGAVAALWRGRVGTASVWADTALVFLLLVGMIFGVVVLAIISALMVGVFLAVRELPEPFARVRLAVAQVERQVGQAADIAARPMIGIRSAAHTVRSTMGYLAGILRGNR